MYKEDDKFVDFIIPAAAFLLLWRDNIGQLCRENDLSNSILYVFLVHAVIIPNNHIDNSICV